MLVVITSKFIISKLNFIECELNIFKHVILIMSYEGIIFVTEAKDQHSFNYKEKESFYHLYLICLRYKNS